MNKEQFNWDSVTQPALDAFRDPHSISDLTLKWMYAAHTVVLGWSLLFGGSTDEQSKSLLSGRLVDEQGNGVAAELVLAVDDGSPSRRKKSLRSGTYSFRILPGSYILRVRHCDEYHEIADIVIESNADYVVEEFQLPTCSTKPDPAEIPLPLHELGI